MGLQWTAIGMDPEDPYGENYYEDEGPDHADLYQRLNDAAHTDGGSIVTTFADDTAHEYEYRWYDAQGRTITIVVIRGEECEDVPTPSTSQDTDRA